MNFVGRVNHFFGNPIRLFRYGLSWCLGVLVVQVGYSGTLGQGRMKPGSTAERLRKSRRQFGTQLRQMK